MGIMNLCAVELSGDNSEIAFSRIWIAVVWISSHTHSKPSLYILQLTEELVDTKGDGPQTGIASC